MFERLKARGFDISALHHAEAVLVHDMPEAISDIEESLLQLTIPIDELVAGGGGEARHTQRLRRALTERGWQKRTIEIKKLVNSRPIMSLSHEIDHVKTFAQYLAALEIEWNNKDPFFDRDLESFKRLHSEGAISVGCIITRGRSLQDELRSLFERFARERGIKSIEDLEKYGYDPTKRQRDEIARRLKSERRSFGDAWAEAFVSDKFGSATTHWSKLADRVNRGVGNPCPLLLIGIPSSVVSFDTQAIAAAGLERLL